MLQPLGFEVNGKEDKVFRLRKALYDLKQAPRAWNKRLDSFLLQLGFVKCFVEHGIYVKAKIDVDLTLVYLYVGDLLVAADGCLSSIH